MPKSKRSQQKKPQEVSHLAQLTRDQAREIWTKYHRKRISQSELARDYHISQPAVSMLVNGLTYKEATKGLRKAA